MEKIAACSSRIPACRGLGMLPPAEICFQLFLKMSYLRANEGQRRETPLTLRSCWTSLLRMSCLGFTVSSPFCISFFHKFTWLPCSTPLSSLRFLSKKVALHILDCCAHKRYRISRVIKRKWRGQEMQNTKGSRVQVINFYARGSVTTK